MVCRLLQVVCVPLAFSYLIQCGCELVGEYTSRIVTPIPRPPCVRYLMRYSISSPLDGMTGSCTAIARDLAFHKARGSF